jgi:hypothetical protein
MDTYAQFIAAVTITLASLDGEIVSPQKRGTQNKTAKINQTNI